MKTLAVIICLLICFSSFAQLSVDSIKTDEDVKAFLRWFGKGKNVDWYNYEILNKDDSSLTLKNVHWLIEDFNNDGNSDMVFNGFIGSQYCLFAALSENTDYNYFNLSQQRYSHFSLENFKKWPVTIQILNKVSYPLLIIKGFKSHYSYLKKEWSMESNIDTLKSFLNGFIEWNPRKKDQVYLDSLRIEFEPTGSSSEMLIINKQILSISQQNELIYNRIVSGYPRTENLSNLNSTFSISLDSITRKTLSDILTQMDIRHMKDSFEVGAMHQMLAQLQIKTNLGFKNIYDYGLDGSYGLRLLYMKLLAIIKNLKLNAAELLTGYDHLLLD